ncbi:MAG: DUF4139 domain-containing protein [Planctomycetes bacterium]|nr:DUF4139 domain-containing protein [Planctomycetota bacterium]
MHRSSSRPLTVTFTVKLAVAAALAIAPVALAQDAPPGEDGPSVTVYSSADPAGFDPTQFVAQQRQGFDPNAAWQVPGYGVVKEIRRVTLKAGRNELPFADVAEFIDPTTVSFTDLTDPTGTAVLEQNFQFDLVSPSKLLEKYVGREIGHETLKDGVPVAKITGKVLSVNQGQVVLQTADGLRFVSATDPGLRLPALPEGLISKPTLLWKLAADKPGEHRVRTTYQTAGMTWRADYNVVLNGTDTQADIGAWVTLMNLSGASYRNAKLKLVAGDVQKIRPQPAWGPPMMDAKPGQARTMGEEAGFEEKSFFEYHLYTLPRRTDVLQNTTQQITLFPSASGVNVEKVLVYYGLADAANWGFFGEPQTVREFGRQGNAKLDVYLRFKNAKDNHLGIPMPKGKVRVYKQDDADGTLEFVGEDLIDHTPRDEKVLVKLGQAFDVVGERTQTDFKIDTSRKTMQETFTIQLRNHKPTPVKVVVKENLYRWTNWEISAKSDEFTPVDARTIHFDVTVPPDGEKTLTYTVRYTW